MPCAAKARRSFDQAVLRLASEGCGAARYRLSGDLVERICSVPFYGRYRALVCFPEDDHVVVLLVGEHVRDDLRVDVYRQLYLMLDLPEPHGERIKPPCCDEDDAAPVDAQLVERFDAGARKLRGRSR